jgi:ATP-binding cassette subfamily D (ALD) protein 3
MLPISVVNSILKYSLQEVALRFRTRLTQHLYENYLKGFTYYKINNLDNRIGNPDQLLTQDVERFCQSLSDLYSNISKPILDIIIYAAKLAGTIGGQGPASMLAYLAFSGVFLTALRKPVSRFTVVEQQLEGEFRYVNSRLITHSEEIAFYNGNKKEEKVIESAFQRLVSHLRKSMQFRFGMGVIDNMIAKYWATVVGYAVVSRPFLDLSSPRHKNSTHNEIMEDYYRSGRMLVNLASAVGRLVLAGRELTRLAGFTARVTELISVLNDLNNDKYVRTMVKEQQQVRLNCLNDANCDFSSRMRHH